ncbi:MAG: hypothetical protein ACWA5R_06735 [bacterium]
MKELTEQQKKHQTQMTMHVLNEWGMTGHGVLDILAMGDLCKLRHLAAFTKGTPFPEDQNVWRRVDHILSIAEALKTMYPAHPSMGPQWMRQPHKRFRGKVPLQVILDDHSNGLNRIRMELDCTYAWEQTGSLKGDGSDRVAIN